MLWVWSDASGASIQKVIVPGLGGTKTGLHVDMKHPPPCKAGDVVLGCGNVVKTWLGTQKLVAKNLSLGGLREKPIVLPSLAKLLLTYDPGIVDIDYSLFPWIQWDARLAARLHNTNSLAPVMGTYTLEENLNEVVDRIEELYSLTGRPVEAGFDLETLGLDEWAPGAWILYAAVSVDPGRSYVLHFPSPSQQPRKPQEGAGSLSYYEELWLQLSWLLTSPKVSVRGSNLKFDRRWMRRHWDMTNENFKFDTVLVGSLLDENRSNSLKLHAKVLTDMGGYDAPMEDFDMGRLDLAPVEDVTQYVGGDADVTLQTATILKRDLLKDRRLTDFYTKLLHPASLVFEKMETSGVLVDVPYYHQLKVEIQEEIGILESRLIDYLPQGLKNKYGDDLSLGSSTLLKEFFFTSAGLNLTPKQFTAKTKAPSTALAHLLSFEDHPDAVEFVSILKKLNSAKKTLSTYVVGFLSHLKSDGRFHPSYYLGVSNYGNSGGDQGTNTGRTSASNPAWQTLPSHTDWTPRLRRAFIAPSGFVPLELDYSQGELRIAADWADEPTMLKAYREGFDLHAITAAKLSGYEFEEFMQLDEQLMDDLRRGGKAGNFGLLYGMQPKGYRAYAKTTYGVVMTDEQAFLAREAFFDMYSALAAWHEASISTARRFGYVRSPFGRIRHLPLIKSPNQEARSKAERQSINSPIQSGLSDMMLLAMVEIDREYGDSPIKMYGMTHDSLGLYVPEDDALEWAKRIKVVMENLPLEQFGWRPKLRFLADAKMGVPDEDGVCHLASLQKLKNL